jgi:hypothetical protein
MKKINFYLLKLFYFFFIFFSIFNLALPIFIDFIISLIVVIFIKDKKIIIILSVLIIISTILTSFILSDYKSEEVFYRPHEKWKTTNLYKKNINDTMRMPFGDIYSLGTDFHNGNIEKIKEPRSVFFKTDKFGLRNNVSLNDAQIILVGDSFIVANGVSQEDMPSSVLSKKLKKKIANIAYPGPPENYESLLIKFKKELKDNVSIYIFYFEGNDFYTKSDFLDNIKNTKLNDKDNKKILKKFFYKSWLFYQAFESYKDIYLTKIYPSNHTFFKIIRRQSHKINQRIFDFGYKLYKNKVFNKDLQKVGKTQSIIINNKEVGFYNPYILNTLNKNGLNTHIFSDKYLLEKIKGIFFIPTKYRIYSSFFGKEINHNAAFNLLKNEYSSLGIPVYNLTSILKEESLKRLKNNEFVFWRDDTHWNPIGIEISMNEVKKHIIDNK